MSLRGTVPSNKESNEEPTWAKGKLLANTGLWSIAAVAWFFASTALSAWTGKWEWFQRSGSILTLAGLMLAGRSIMRQGRAGVGTKPSATIATLGAGRVRNGQVYASVQYSPETKRRWFEESRDATAAVVGLVLAIVGTAVWGYGDLLGCIFSRHP